jgi:hypothetical protein
MGLRRGWQMDAAVIFRLLHGVFLFHLASKCSNSYPSQYTPSEFFSVQLYVKYI